MVVEKIRPNNRIGDGGCPGITPEIAWKGELQQQTYKENGWAKINK